MTKQKKVFFWLITAMLVLCLIEIVCFSALCFFQGENPSSQAVAICQNPEASPKIILPPWMTKNIGRFIIHPYLGLVYNPQELEITKFGFLDKRNPIQKRSKDKIIIGIFGGSSAEIFAQYGQDVLKDQLKKIAAFRNKEIIVLNLAIGSYKQPQQLMALNYILALGGEFDFVINMDGFNELVLPVLDNIPNNVHPFFPRRWDLKVIDKQTLDPEIVILGDILRLKKQKLKINSFINCGILRFSQAALFLNRCFNRSIDLKVTHKRMQLFKLQNEQSKDIQSVIGHGPDFPYENDSKIYKELTLLWARTSKQMHDICLAQEIEYIHFLQPSQYVPGAKPMQDEELEVAFDKDALHRQIVITGYPLLQKQAENLRQDGVKFYDLTKVFINHDEPLYIDSFCHFGDKGSKIVAELISRKIVDMSKGSKNQ